MAPRLEMITALILTEVAWALFKATGFINSSVRKVRLKIEHSKLSSSIRVYRHLRLRSDSRAAWRFYVDASTIRREFVSDCWGSKPDRMACWTYIARIGRERHCQGHSI